jgi:hypothetical protein
VQELGGLSATCDDDGPGGSSRPLVIPLNNGGRAAWEASLGDAPRQRQQWRQQTDAPDHAARLALLVQVVRAYAKDPTLESDYGVDAASVRSGVTLARWFETHQRRLACELSVAGQNDRRKSLVEHVRALSAPELHGEGGERGEGGGERGGGGGGAGVSIRDLMRAGPRFHHAADARRALDDLVARGLGQWVRPAGNGRGRKPDERFVLTATTGPAEADRALVPRVSIVSDSSSVTRVAEPVKVGSRRAGDGPGDEIARCQ